MKTFNALTQLVAEVGRPLFLFDLETTSFMGKPNFGIMEMAALIIKLDGTTSRFSTLFNPKRAIDPIVTQITGLSQGDLQGKPAWAYKVGKSMSRVANDYLVSGFGIRSFDCHAVKRENERFGLEPPVFATVLDVRDVLKALAGRTNGKLVEIAETYGVLSPNAHRADADVNMTAGVLDKLVVRYGPGAVAQCVRAH